MNRYLVAVLSLVLWHTTASAADYFWTGYQDKAFSSAVSACMSFVQEAPSHREYVRTEVSGNGSVATCFIKTRSRPGSMQTGLFTAVVILALPILSTTQLPVSVWRPNRTNAPRQPANSSTSTTPDRWTRPYRRRCRHPRFVKVAASTTAPPRLKAATVFWKTPPARIWTPFTARWFTGVPARNAPRTTRLPAASSISHRPPPADSTPQFTSESQCGDWVTNADGSQSRNCTSSEN